MTESRSRERIVLPRPCNFLQNLFGVVNLMPEVLRDISYLLNNCFVVLTPFMLRRELSSYFSFTLTVLPASFVFVFCLVVCFFRFQTKIFFFVLFSLLMILQ